MGGSMEIWSGAFPNGQVVGVDLKTPKVPKPEGGGYVPYQFKGQNITFRQRSQDDAPLLTAVSQEHAPQGWDIIAAAALQENQPAWGGVQ